MQAAEDIGFRLPVIHCYCLRYQEGGIQMLSYGTIEPHTLELLRQLSGHPLNSEMRLVGGTALALQSCPVDRFSTTDWTDSCPVSAESKTKTPKTPWRGWRALPLLLCFRLGLIRASSERPNRKRTTTFILKVTILAKAINRDKPFPVLRRTALST